MKYKQEIFVIFSLFMVLLCCFSAASASKDKNDDIISVCDDVTVDEATSEVDSKNESITASDDEDLEYVDDSGNESFSLQNAKQANMDDTTLTVENDNQLIDYHHLI